MNDYGILTHSENDWNYIYGIYLQDRTKSTNIGRMTKIRAEQLLERLKLAYPQDSFQITYIPLN